MEDVTVPLLPEENAHKITGVETLILANVKATKRAQG
jgi:hypothetical protein